MKDFNDVSFANSARELSYNDKQRAAEEAKRSEQSINRQRIAQAPIHGELKKNTDILRRQLEKQNEEIETLKNQLKQTEKDSEDAKKDARRSKIFSWLSFSITVALAVASLLVAILK